MRSPTRFLTVLVALLLIAGCGSSDDGATDETTAAAATTTTTAPTTTMAPTTTTALPTTTSTASLSEEEQIAAAGAILDRWNQGWNDVDPDVVLSVFTDDAVYITEDGETQTMEVLRADVPNYGGMITNAVRVGECTPVSDDTYACAAEFDAHGYRYATAITEIELEGDLALRFEFLGEHVEIGLASDYAPGALDVTIESTLDSLGASPAPIGTFLAMGPAVDEGVMCPSGTLEERGRSSDDGITGRLEVTFVCADDSGDFLVEYDLHTGYEDGVYTESGLWTIGRVTGVGWTPRPDATGAYENLVGAGHDTTTEVDDTAVSVSTGQVAIVSG